MNWFLILISTFYIPALAGGVAATAKLETRAALLLELTVPQDGPNCFNTSLYLQGFTQDLVYSSQTELDFYLHNYCHENPQQDLLKSRDLVTFVNPDDPTQIAHTVVSLKGNEIIEKSSLMGSLAPVQVEDPEPGQYLKRDITLSLYSAPTSEKLFGSTFRTKSFRCQSPAQVAKALAPVRKNPAIQEQLLFRNELAKTLALTDRKELDSKILSSLVPMMAAMKWNKISVKDPVEIQYLQALLRSNAYQMHLLNCSDSIRRSGECFVPHLQKSTTQTEAWFEKIYAFEKRNHLK